jgi:hypothetical protein
MLELSEQQIIDQLAQRLAEKHVQIEPARVTRVVHEEYARFEGRPIRDFVPLFVERNAAQELAKPGAWPAPRRPFLESGHRGLPASGRLTAIPVR